MDDDDKYAKEQYVFTPNDIHFWRKHSNYDIIQRYKEYFRGKTADFGCNIGMTCLFHSEFNRVHEVVGFDISKIALEEAEVKSRSWAPVTQHKITFKHNNLLSIDAEDNYFDTTTCFHTIEHFFEEDLIPILKEFHRVIRPGGFIIMCVPREECYPDEHHEIEFTEESINNTFHEAGFEKIECYPDDVVQYKILTGVYRKPKPKK